MTLRIELATGRIEHGELGYSNKRLARFIAVLAHAAEGPQPEVNAALAAHAIGASVKQTRHVFLRLFRAMEKQVFLEGVVHWRQHRTTGPWFLNPEWRRRVEVLLHGKQLSADELLSRHANVGSRHTPKLAAEPLLASQALTLIQGDRAFAHGNLQRARTAYSSIHVTQDGHAIAAIASARLIQTLIRLEDHDGVFAASKRLGTVSNSIENSILAEHMKLRADISRAWHTYSKDHRYDVTNARLLKIRDRSQAFSDIYIDWLNLFGLSERRLALEWFERDPASEKYRLYAHSALSALNDALMFSLAFGTPYQMQKACSNLANVTGLFLHGAHGDLLKYPSTPELALSLLGISEYICEHMGIGRDDLYNPIYILSIARKFEIPASDLELWRRVGLSEVAGSLAMYGHKEYTYVGSQGEGPGPEQQAFLSYEICWSAATEGDEDRFDHYFKELIKASWQVPDGNKATLRDRVEKVLKYSADGHQNSGPWMEVIDSLRAFQPDDGP